MKILKHGNLSLRKFICKNCGCEFVADNTEYWQAECNGKVLWWIAECPECDNRTTDSEPWRE